MQFVHQGVCAGKEGGGQEREAVLDVWYTGSRPGGSWFESTWATTAQQRECVRFCHTSIQGAPLHGAN